MLGLPEFITNPLVGKQNPTTGYMHFRQEDTAFVDQPRQPHLPCIPCLKENSHKVANTLLSLDFDLKPKAYLTTTEGLIIPYNVSYTFSLQNSNDIDARCTYPIEFAHEYLQSTSFINTSYGHYHQNPRSVAKLSKEQLNAEVNFDQDQLFFSCNIDRNQRHICMAFHCVVTDEHWQEIRTAFNEHVTVNIYTLCHHMSFQSIHHFAKTFLQSFNSDTYLQLINLLTKQNFQSEAVMSELYDAQEHELREKISIANQDADIIIQFIYEQSQKLTHSDLRLFFFEIIYDELHQVKQGWSNSIKYAQQELAYHIALTSLVVRHDNITMHSLHFYQEASKQLLWNNWLEQVPEFKDPVAKQTALAHTSAEPPATVFEGCEYTTLKRLHFVTLLSPWTAYRPYGRKIQTHEIDIAEQIDLKTLLKFIKHSYIKRLFHREKYDELEALSGEISNQLHRFNIDHLPEHQEHLQHFMQRIALVAYHHEVACLDNCLSIFCGPKKTKGQMEWENLTFHSETGRTTHELTKSDGTRQIIVDQTVIYSFQGYKAYARAENILS